jgi:hypothetical protein
MDNLSNNIGANLSRFANSLINNDDSNDNQNNTVISESNINPIIVNLTNKDSEKEFDDNFNQKKMLSKSNYNNTTYVESIRTETIKEPYDINNINNNNNTQENNKNKEKEDENFIFTKIVNYIYDKNKILLKTEQNNPLKKYDKNGYKEFYSDNEYEKEKENNTLNENETIMNSIYIKYKNENNKNEEETNLNKENENFDNIEYIYKGEMTKEKIPNGFGIKIFNNGIKQTGNFIKGNFTGWNELIDKEGNIYRGYFKNEILNGKGEKYNFKNNTIYKGNFINNEKNGKGKIEYLQSGNFYEGNFQNNLFNGKGYFKNKINGNEYIGNYKNGLMNGEGKFKWSENEYYEGNFVNGIREGKGKIHYRNGRSFIGNFSQGRPNGFGVFNNGFGFEKNVTFENGKIKIENNNEF